MIRHLATDVLRKDEFHYRGHTVNLAQPFLRAPMIQLVKEYAGIDLSDMNLERALAFCKERRLEIPAGAGVGRLIALLFEHYVEEKLVQPTFVTDFPKEISPLAKAKPGNPDLAERFELFIAGHEFANAFSELNDPLDQRERLEAQASLRALGDEEANVVDEDFLEALEYGMPPMGGMGIGIDRLVMLLTENDSIKEVILFPQMKPE
jgi:lysyl-tRNA synthetase class 2